MSEPIIDSHQHFWQLSRGDYHCLTSNTKRLYQDFLPGDLKPILDKLNIHGTILIQAAPTLAETEFLLTIANDINFVLGVVGWVDMESKRSPDSIAKFFEKKYFRGIRPMMQDIPDEDWMLQPRLRDTFNTLIELDLGFDALIKPIHLKSLMRLLDRYPDLRCVIDHAAKPAIKTGAFEPWADDIEMIARHSHAYCKLSGLISEAGAEWTTDSLLPYIDHVIGCFGPERVMWGSDWPMITVHSSYQQWFEWIREYMDRQFPESLPNIFGGVAREFYKIG